MSDSKPNCSSDYQGEKLEIGEKGRVSEKNGDIRKRYDLKKVLGT